MDQRIEGTARLICARERRARSRENGRAIIGVTTIADHSSTHRDPMAEMIRPGLQKASDTR